jgi:hypothetical protein
MVATAAAIMVDTDTDPVGVSRIRTGLAGAARSLRIVVFQPSFEGSGGGVVEALVRS